MDFSGTRVVPIAYTKVWPVDLLYEAEHGAPLIPEKAGLSAYADRDQSSDWAYLSLSAFGKSPKPAPG